MATLKALIVDPDGTTRETEVENSLGAFQAVVGGYIEGVFCNTATIYVNEEGLLIGLPFNLQATLFAHRVGAAVNLVGTALILGPADDQAGYDTDVRPAVVDYFNLED